MQSTLDDFKKLLNKAGEPVHLMEDSVDLFMRKYESIYPDKSINDFSSFAKAYGQAKGKQLKNSLSARPELWSDESMMTVFFSATFMEAVFLYLKFLDEKNN